MLAHRGFPTNSAKGWRGNMVFPRGRAILWHSIARPLKKYMCALSAHTALYALLSALGGGAGDTVPQYRPSPRENHVFSPPPFAVRAK